MNRLSYRCHTLPDVPTYSLRPDPELDAALDFLGATPGNRSKIMREAILALADVRRLEADLVAEPELSRELQIMRTRIDMLIRSIR